MLYSLYENWKEVLGTRGDGGRDGRWHHSPSLTTALSGYLDSLGVSDRSLGNIGRFSLGQCFPNFDLCK